MTDRFYKALRLAIQAHAGQYDKGGFPYILHPLHVASKMDNDGERIIAILHDVVEDTNVTLEDLRSYGFSDVIDPIERLTRRKGKETYAEYMERVCGDCRALKVKIEDMRHNMDTSRLSDASCQGLQKKYAKWLPLLESRLSEY